MLHEIYHDIEISLGKYSVTASVTESFTEEDRLLSRQPTHQHLGYELCLFIEGEGKALLEGEACRVRPGDFLLVAPNQKHTFEPDEGCPGLLCHNFLLFLRPAKAGGSQGCRDADRLVKALPAQKRLRLIPHSPALRDRLLSLRDELREKRPGYHEAARHLLALLVLELGRTLCQEPDGQSAPASGKAEKNAAQIIEDFLLIRPNHRYLRKDLAALLYMSERHLERLLKTLYGKPFRAILLDARMETAQYYVTQSALPLFEIARLVGYGSPNAFQSAYKAYYGRTPSTARTLGRAPDR